MSRQTSEEPDTEGREEVTAERIVEERTDGPAGHVVREESMTVERRWTGPPRRNRVLIVGAVAVVALLALVYALFLRDPAKEEKAEAPAATNPTGTVTFLMEQQWLIRMKLALVEEQTVARQITATGRVVPAANSQAMVAPPVSGILAGGRMPRVGQRVAAGQTIAIIQQTATSAEHAQVRAAAAQVQAQNAQVAVENARLDSERRAAVGEAEAARVRLDLAQKEAERAQ